MDVAVIKYTVQENRIYANKWSENDEFKSLVQVARVKFITSFNRDSILIWGSMGEVKKIVGLQWLGRKLGDKDLGGWDMFYVDLRKLFKSDVIWV